MTEATLYSHSSRLGHFVTWCQLNEIENLNELTGRDLHQYRLWRREKGELSPVTEKTQIDTLRVFVEWLETIDAVTPDLHTRARSPMLNDKENVRDVMLADNRAEDIPDHMAKYEYATRPHVVLKLLWHTFMRVGAVHALDVSDYDAEEQVLDVNHRPETGTPIKNQHGGERLVAVSDEVCGLLDDWIGTRRPDVTDDHGRKPLIASEQGRVHKTTLREDCYR